MISADAQTRPASRSPATAQSLRRFASAHSDLLIVSALTLLAAVARLWGLERIPPGLHGDEALTGLDALRIQDEGWIGPYVPSALGQPSGPLYWAALVLEFAGRSVFGVRLSMALLGIATVPGIYFAGRQLFDRRVGLLAAALLAVMTWHLTYSRTAFMVVSWPLVEAVFIGLLFLALKREHAWIYALAGAVLGLGVYSYNVYPLFVLAVVLLTPLLLLKQRRIDVERLKRLALMFGVSFLVALPLLLYASDEKHDYFAHHRLYSLTNTQQWREADLAGRADLILDKTQTWVEQMALRKHPDFVDASGTRPVLDCLTLTLSLAGLAYCLLRWKQSSSQLMLLMLLVIPFGSIMTIDGGFRRSLGLVPVVALLCAVPLAEAWRVAEARAGLQRQLVCLLVAAVVVLFGVINLRAYFEDIGSSEVARWVYAEQIAEASKYMDAYPGQPYVYFYSARWSFYYETRQFLAPDNQGEDRSREFGRLQSYDVPRSRNALLILISPYDMDLPRLQALYPDASVYIKQSGGQTLFVAVFLPKRL